MLTVRSALSRDIFQNSRLSAGAQGLDRVIRWVHVGEIPNVADFLQGGELVLTTGLGLRDPAHRRRFFDGLIRVGAAGLALELGDYLPEPPDDLVEWAEAAGLPFVVFPEPVRFLTISQTINTEILNAHYEFLESLESLSHQLRRALLETRGLRAIIEILAHAVAVPVLYVPRDPTEATLAVGHWPGPPFWPLGDVAWRPERRERPYAHLRQTVLVFGQAVGDVLVAPSLAERSDERVYLAMDRAVEAAAQEVIRQYALDRRQREYDARHLEALVTDPVGAWDAAHKIVVLYRVGDDDRSAAIAMTDCPDLSAVERLRRQLLAGGATACLVLPQASVITLAVVGSGRWLATLRTRLDPWAKGAGARLGLSGMARTAEQLMQAVQESEEAFSFRQHVSAPGASAYDELGLYRWIVATPAEVIQRALLPELFPVLRHDRDRNPPLLPTLVAVLENPDDKSVAAAKLGIHRQTLYNRIRALEQLLGTTFMLPEKRTALYAAWLALKLYPELAPQDTGRS
jgi:purine catabolism regulator